VVSSGCPFDAAERETPLIRDVAHGVIAAHLSFEELRGQPVTVIVHAGMVFQPFTPGPGASGVDEVGAADDLPLIDLLDVDAEVLHPLAGLVDRRVHAHRSTADPAEHHAAETGDDACRLGAIGHGRQHVVVVDVAPHSAVIPAEPVERAAGGEHADHAGEPRVDVAEQQHLTGSR